MNADFRTGFKFGLSHMPVLFIMAIGSLMLVSVSDMNLPIMMHVPVYMLLAFWPYETVMSYLRKNTTESGAELRRGFRRGFIRATVVSYVTFIATYSLNWGEYNMLSTIASLVVMSSLVVLSLSLLRFDRD
jgi:hypothetical protein